MHEGLDELLVLLAAAEVAKDEVAKDEGLPPRLGAFVFGVVAVNIEPGCSTPGTSEGL